MVHWGSERVPRVSSCWNRFVASSADDNPRKLRLLHWIASWRAKFSYRQRWLSPSKVLIFVICSNDYLRTIGLGIPAHSWAPFIAEVYRVLKPGSGWAMFLEVGSGFKSDDGSLPEDAAIVKVRIPWNGVNSFSGIAIQLKLWQSRALIWELEVGSGSSSRVNHLSTSESRKSRWFTGHGHRV